jgi:hypothetical protein
MVCVTLYDIKYNKKEHKTGIHEWFVLVFKSDDLEVHQAIEIEDFDAKDWVLGAIYSATGIDAGNLVEIPEKGKEDINNHKIDEFVASDKEDE